MQSVDELTIAAVRAAMAPGYDLDAVAADLADRAHRNITALRLAKARVERGAGWRAGPIGQRARDALGRAMELAVRPADEIDLTGAVAPDEIDLTEESRSSA